MDIKDLFKEMFVNINDISCGEKRIHISKQYYFELKQKYIGLTKDEENEYNNYLNSVKK